MAARPSALGYIQLMRLCWRLGEQKDARKAFKKARADPCLSWQVFDAAAQCELCLSLQADEGAQVAARIYAMGVDKFPTEVPLLLRYLRFLQAARDHTNMRALLEKSLQAVTGEGSRELWREYVELEVAYGDAASVRAVADRRAAVFPEYDPASLFSVAAQYAYAGVWPATPSALTPPPQPSAADAGSGAQGGGGGGARSKWVVGSAERPMVLPDLASLSEYTGLSAPPRDPRGGGAPPAPSAPSAPAAGAGAAAPPRRRRSSPRSSPRCRRRRRPTPARCSASSTGSPTCRAAAAAAAAEGGRAAGAPSRRSRRAAAPSRWGCSRWAGSGKLITFRQSEGESHSHSTLTDRGGRSPWERARSNGSSRRRSHRTPIRRVCRRPSSRRSGGSRRPPRPPHAKSSSGKG